MSKSILHYALMAALCMTSFGAYAEIEIAVSKISTSGIGKNIGTINAKNAPNGLLLTPNLFELPPGDHGFHIHQNPSCEALEKDGAPVAGLSAGGHFDPQNTGKHKGYMGEGHKGDLPVIVVNSEGRADTPVIVPHLKEADIYGRSIVIHAGGDNYSDMPQPLGGGGARIACGVIGHPEKGVDDALDQSNVGNLFTFFHDLLNGFDSD
jgi:Cu-Zn family superoxide dismutase